MSFEEYSMPKQNGKTNNFLSSKTQMSHINQNSNKRHLRREPVDRCHDYEKNEELGLYRASPSTCFRFKQRLNESKENFKANEIKEEDEGESDVDATTNQVFVDKNENISSFLNYNNSKLKIDYVKINKNKSVKLNRKLFKRKVKVPVIRINEMSDSSDEKKNEARNSNRTDTSLSFRSSLSDFALRSEDNLSSARKSDDENQEENDEHLNDDGSNAKLRVERFLSVCEIPQEVILFSQQNYARNNKVKEKSTSDLSSFRSSIKLSSRNHTPDIIKNLDLKNSNRSSSRSAADSKLSLNLNAGKIGVNKPGKVKYYHDGSGLPQSVKAEIIRNILKKLNVEKYIKDFKAQDAVEIKLRHNEAKFRPIRERMLRFMNTDVIRINDSEFMHELSEKIQESQKEKQEKLIDRLAENERKRERKLLLKGLIENTSDEFNLPDINVQSRRLSRISIRHN